MSYSLPFFVVNYFQLMDEEPQLCRAWRIYNEYRKEMGRSGAIESARR